MELMIFDISSASLKSRQMWAYFDLLTNYNWVVTSKLNVER